MESTEAYHGGNLQEAETRFGRPNEGWLDLSTGINATPYPHTTLSEAAWQRLPQAAAEEALLEAARRYYKVPENTEIVATPGSQSLLQLLPSLLPNRKVAILGPTYEEHEKLWTTTARRIWTISAFAEAEGADTVVLVNPNNPDGRTIAPADLLDLARTLPKPDGLLVVDEAFADLHASCSVLPHMKGAPILSIRSFGKFFGLPGLRLGFAVGAAPIIVALRERLGPWAVSGPALEIGARALADTAWIERTHDALMARAKALDNILSHTGLTVIGGTALFRLVQSETVPDLFKRLGAAGIFVRQFHDRKDLLRFGVPGTQEDMARLQRALG